MNRRSSFVQANLPGTGKFNELASCSTSAFVAYRKKLFMSSSTCAETTISLFQIFAFGFDSDRARRFTQMSREEINTKKSLINQPFRVVGWISSSHESVTLNFL